MEDNFQEKEHQATEKKLNDLRKKGQVMRSRDFSGGLIILLTGLGILFLSTHVALGLKNNFIYSFSSVSELIAQEDFMREYIYSVLTHNFFLVLPILLISLLAALSVPLFFGGWNFTLEAVNFNWGRFDVIKNITNIFSKRIFVEVSKSLIKAIVISLVVFMFLYNQFELVKHLMYLPALSAINLTTDLLQNFFTYVCVGVILMVLFDVGYQYFDYQNRNKMSTQELRDEFKEGEGNPEVKKKIRKTQHGMMKQRLQLLVPKANVIITNPTHYAVALFYDPKKDNAPKLIAKGKDYIAQMIRTIAISHGVPIYEAPMLARAIYKTTKLDAEVHPELYMAVAIVLTYVQQLKQFQYGIGQEPKMVREFNLPPSFIYDE